MCLQPHLLIRHLAVPWLLRISSSGLVQREWVTRTARLSLVTTIYNYTNYKSWILPSMVYWFPIENGIIPSGFLLCDAEDFDDIGLTKIGKKLLLKIFTEVKGIVNLSQIESLCMGFTLTHITTWTLFTLPHTGQRDQQPAEEDHPHEGSRGQAPQHSRQAPSSERLPPQQQPPRSSTATPCRTTQHQLSSSTDGQQTKLGRQSHHAYTTLVHTHACTKSPWYSLRQVTW
jgi:hypothetical protein